MTLEDIIDSAIEDLTEQMRDGRDTDEAIPEIADSAVPVYNWDILSVVAESSDLWNAEPENYQGDMTPVRVCQLVIYDAVEQALYNAVDDIQDELDEETVTEDLEDEDEDETPMPPTATGTCRDCRYGNQGLDFRYCKQCSTLTSPWSRYKYRAFAA